MTAIIPRFSDQHRVLVVLKGSAFKRPTSIAYMAGLPTSRAQSALLGLLRKAVVERPERGRYQVNPAASYVVAS